jgi:hypothetical protein
VNFLSEVRSEVRSRERGWGGSIRDLKGKERGIWKRGEGESSTRS